MEMIKLNEMTENEQTLFETILCYLTLLALASSSYAYGRVEPGQAQAIPCSWADHLHFLNV